MVIANMAIGISFDSIWQYAQSFITDNSGLITAILGIVIGVWLIGELIEIVAAKRAPKKED